MTSCFPEEKSASVVDIQWDPLSDFYALAAYKNGDITLWDMETRTSLITPAMSDDTRHV